MAFLLLGLARAFAADSVFAGSTAPGQLLGAPVSSLSLQFGGNWTTGNTNAYTVTTGGNVARRWDRNRVSGTLAASIGRTRADADGDGHLDAAERAVAPIETARKYAAEGRYDRYVGDRDSLYALTGAAADPFAGQDLRAHGQVGFSRNFVTARDRTLVGEAGGDVAREDRVEGSEPEIAWVVAARVMAKGTYRFNPTVAAQAQIEALDNVVAPGDLRVLSTVALAARMARRLDFQVSTQLAWDRQPVEGFARLDQVTLASFVANVP